MAIIDLKTKGDRAVASKNSNNVSVYNDARVSDISLDQINGSFLTIDRGKTLATLQYAPMNNRKAGGQASGGGNKKDVLRSKRKLDHKSKNKQDDEVDLQCSASTRAHLGVETRKTHKSDNTTFPKLKYPRTMKVLVFDEKREMISDDDTNYNEEMSRKFKSTARSSKKRAEPNNSVASSKTTKKQCEPRERRSGPRSVYFGNAQDISSEDIIDESSSDTHMNETNNIIPINNIHTELPSNDSQKAQTSNRDIELNLDIDREEIYEAGLDGDHSYILKVVDKSIRILKKRCDISIKLTCMQKLCEKLSFAMAYAGLGTSILGNPEIKKLSAALIKVIESYPRVVSKESSLKNEQISSNLKTKTLKENGHGNTFDSDREHAFKLAVLACNGLSLIIEDLSDKVKIIICNGAINAFVKRLNGSDRADFAEHIIGLVFKISMEYPSCLRSKNLRAGIIKNIDYLDVHMQSTAMLALSNIVGVLLSDKKKQVRSKSKSINNDNRDLYELAKAVRNYLFSPDKKVVENTTCLLSMVTELIAKSDGSLDSLFDNSILGRLVDLLSASIGVNSERLSPVVSQFNVQSVNLPPFLGTLSDQSFSFLIKILILAVRGSNSAGLALVQKLGFLDVIRAFFVNDLSIQTPLHSSHLVKLKSLVVDMLLDSKSTFAFDLLHLFSSLISFQPTSANVLGILNKNLKVPYVDTLFDRENIDTEICDLIVQEEALLHSFVELLGTSYNFYLMYELMNILTKILWCSSMTSSIEKFLTNMEVMEKITRSCFDVGIGYYSKENFDYTSKNDNYQYIQTYVHDPHYVHARTLFEQSLNFEHLLIIRYGPSALKCISRNGTAIYIDRAMVSLKKYYGTVDYYLRSRRNTPRPSKLSNLNSSFYSNNRQLSHTCCAPSYKKSSKHRCVNICTHDSVNTAKLPFEDYDKIAGIDVDDSSDEFNRVTFELCAILKGQIIQFNTLTNKTDYPLTIDHGSLTKFIDSDDSLRLAAELADIANMIVGKNQDPLNALEFATSGLLDRLLLYLSDLNNNVCVNSLLHVFTGSVNLLGSTKYLHLEGAHEALIRLLNSTLTLLGLFPNFGSEIVGNFSVPLRGRDFLESCTEKAPTPLKNAFFWPNMPTPSGYYYCQFEKRLKLKLLVGEGADEFIRKLQGSKYNLHVLSDTSNFTTYLSQKIKYCDINVPGNTNLKSLLMKACEGDTKHMGFHLDENNSDSTPNNVTLDSVPEEILYDDDYDDDVDEFDADGDNSLEIVNLLVSDDMEGDYMNVEYVSNDTRSIFGISYLESPNAPVSLDLTNIKYSNIMCPDGPIETFDNLGKFSARFIGNLMGEFAFALPKELRSKPKYRFRASSTQQKINVTIPEHYSEVNGKNLVPTQYPNQSSINVNLYIGDKLFKPNDIIANVIYNRYLAQPKIALQNLYNNFFEIELKKKSDSHDGNYSTNDPNTPGDLSDDHLDDDGEFQFSNGYSSNECNQHSIYPVAIYRILEILKFLYKSRTSWPDYHLKSDYYDNYLFINPVFTSRTLRQLEEPITAFTKIIPKQCTELFKNYKFLFPYELRKLYFEIMTLSFPKVTRIWKDRSLGELKLVDDESRYVNKIRRMGHIPRLKVKITRSNILETAMHILFEYAGISGEVTIEYENEVGAGLGPTLEFYSNLCTEVQRQCYSDKNSKSMFALWRNVNTDIRVIPINTNSSLFPAPIPPLWKKGARAEREYAKMLYNTLNVFALLGCFIAKSIVDSRLIDLPLSRLFIEMVFFNNSPVTNGLESIELIKGFDVDFYNSLKFIKKFVDAKRQIANSNLPLYQRNLLISQIKIDNVSIEDLYLDFTYPGYFNFELVPNGSKVGVTIENMDKYLESLIDYTLGTGINKQMEALRRGFNSAIPIKNMRCFYPEEIIGIITDERKSLSYEDVISSIKTDHGYTISSPTIINFARMVSEFSTVQLRMFMQFMTGSTRLPKNGLKGLVPPLTIVKKSDNCTDPDTHLPSVMTCVNYLKLPDYSNINVLRSRFLYSINEGLNSFHLS